MISRNGDLYQFLTNEERDVNREIKSVDLNSSEEAKLIGDIIFEEVLKGQRKHRFVINKTDLPFNRLCDLHPVGNRSEGALPVSVITPLNDDYELYQDERCILESANDDGQVLVRLRDEKSLGPELRTYLQTEKYNRTKNDGTLPASTKTILRHLADDNRERRNRLVGLMDTMLTEADYFVASTRITPKAVSAQGMLDEALEYLIKNTFTKMSYLAHLNDSPTKEIQAILRSNDIGQQTLAVDLPESNPDAINDLRQHIDRCTRTSRQIVMHEMVTGRYAQRPYGWPDMEVALLLSRLVVLGEIDLVSGGDVVSPNKLYDTLTTQSLWRKTQIVQRKTADPAAIQMARNTAKDVFSQIAPDGEDALSKHLRDHLGKWHNDLQQWKALADTGNYPGMQDITEGLGVAKNLLGCEDSRKLIERFNEQEQDLRDFADTFGDLRQFYEHQKPTWEKLRAAYGKFQLNRLQLDRDETAAPALRRMNEILSAQSPFALIQKAADLIQKVDQVNNTIVAQRRNAAQRKVQQALDQMAAEADSAGVEGPVKQACVAPLEKLKAQVEQQESLAHLAQDEAETERAFEAGMQRLEAAVQPPPPPPDGGDTPPQTPAVKPRYVVRPSELTSKPYLETTEEVGTFVDTLKKTMDAAIADGKRIQIK